MENKEPIGFLFNSIAYYSEESVDNMIDSLSKENIVYILKQALEYSHSKNIFSLLESEIISKSLRIINKEVFSDYDKPRQESDNIEDY